MCEAHTLHWLSLNLWSCEFTQRHVWLMKVRTKYNIPACFTTSQPTALLWGRGEDSRHVSQTLLLFIMQRCCWIIQYQNAITVLIIELLVCGWLVCRPLTHHHLSVGERVQCIWRWQRWYSLFQCWNTSETMRNLSIQTTYRRPNTQWIISMFPMGNCRCCTRYYKLTFHPPSLSTLSNSLIPCGEEKQIKQYINAQKHISPREAGRTFAGL